MNRILLYKKKFIYIAYFVAIFVSFYFLKNELIVKKIIVEGASSLYGLERLYKKNIILLNLDIERRILLDKNPSALDIYLEKKFPSTLFIKVSSENIKISLKCDEGYLLISSEGKVIMHIKDKFEIKDLPMISFYQILYCKEFRRGEKVSIPEIQASAYILKQLYLNGIKIISVDIYGLDMILCKSKEEKFIFSAGKDLNKQVYKVIAIEKAFRIQGRKIETLDVRFDKPVVTFRT